VSPACLAGDVLFTAWVWLCDSWSNAKAIWANAHPMSSEELITKQAEMVYADDPGVPGYAPRVWAYRNTIKALNWYTSVRTKLDDPRYACSPPSFVHV